MKIVDVEKVYNEEKDLKKEHVKQLMEWADKQPHLPKISGKYGIQNEWFPFENLFLFKFRITGVPFFE